MNALLNASERVRILDVIGRRIVYTRGMILERFENVHLARVMIDPVHNDHERFQGTRLRECNCCM